MTLNEVPPLHLHESVVLKANIRDVSKCLSLIWIKHDQDIDNSKYEVSFTNTSAVFCINDVKREDAGTYTIEVHNEFGKGQSSRKLEVVGGK